MSRKTVDITIDGDNRDKGKVFRLTEMPASRAERWAARALVALLNANPDVDDLPHPSQGMAGLAGVVNRLGSLAWDEVQPLYDELLSCVEYELPDKPGVRLPLTPQTLDAYVEEASTLLRLRLEVVGLHVGFSGAAVLSTLETKAAGLLAANMRTSPA